MLAGILLLNPEGTNKSLCFGGSAPGQVVEGEGTGLSSSPTPHRCDLLWLRRFGGWL